MFLLFYLKDCTISNQTYFCFPVNYDWTYVVMTVTTSATKPEIYNEVTGNV